MIARGNTARLLAHGGREHGAAHYPVIVLMHTAWIAGLWLLAWGQPINLWLLGAFGVLQAGRAWVLATLGRRWTTRIISVPGEAPVTGGPFRLVRHPNYLIVALEIACLPAVFALWGFAAVFFVLNLAVLTIRLRVEAAVWRGAEGA